MFDNCTLDNANTLFDNSHSFCWWRTSTIASGKSWLDAYRENPNYLFGYYCSK